MQDLALSGERPAENDEPVIDERVHEPSVLVPTVLFPQIA
jgi:hypothetical protein